MEKIRNLILYLTISIRTGAFFEKSNETYRKHIQRLFEIIADLLKERGDFTLKMKINYIFLDDDRIDVSLDIMGPYRLLLNELTIRNIEEITFHKGLEKEELNDFIFIISRTFPKDSKDFEELIGYLRNRGIKNISITMLSKEQHVEQDKSFKREALKIFLNSIFYLKDAFESLYTNEQINLTKARKIIKLFTDYVLQDETFMIGLTTIKNIGSYTLNHSVNVSILSIALGIKLGLEKRDITELGMAGFFHDIGKSNISEEILEKPAPLTEEEFEIIKKHPHWSAERLLLIRGLKNIPAFALRGILEHHIDYDGSGYPKLNIEKPSLFARILRVVDTYDAMTTARCYQKAFTPIEAINYIISKKGEIFDPVIVDKFVELLGTYPPGTIVQLTSGEIGMFLEDGNIAILKEGGSKIETDTPRKKVKKILSGEEVNIDPTSIFIKYTSMQ
uniref:HD-GYP domain-containing protein n=1 Tax=candidate division WOR-3 bacterium TaxID=2052148 RepID=A0A7C4U929_UNCW3